MRLCIANGTIVTERTEFKGDLLIDGEKIQAVGKELSGQADRVIDASGKYLFPGGVDQHTHFGSFGGLLFDTTVAAAVGGTTTIVDFAPQNRGESLGDAVERHASLASAQCCVDYAFHSMIMDARPDTFEQIKELPAHGVSSVKVFMAYKGTSFYVGDEQILRAMLEAKKVGVTMMVHAENADIITVETERLLRSGHVDPVYHYYARPPIAETEATRRAIFLAEFADCPLMLMHVTTAGALQAVREAYERGQRVSGETCTHYLTLDTSYLAKENEEGSKYVCSPPLRPKEHAAALWSGLAQGWLCAVSSDHCAVAGGFAVKKGNPNFAKIPNGVPGVQERMGVLWSKGVMEHRMSRQKFVEVTASAPARNLGLRNKGQLAPGYDADVVVFDPQYRGTFTAADSLSGLDYSVYEGFPMTGRPEKVFLRGNLIAENGKYVGREVKGKRQSCEPYSGPYMLTPGIL